MDGLPDPLREPAPIFKDIGKSGWSNEDVLRQAVGLGLLGMDWGQTRTIAKNPDQYSEINKILGPHPSVGRVNNYFLASMLGHTLLMNLLPPEYRKWGQLGLIGLEAPVVGKNKFGLGIGMTF